jgi:hypothetical protein
MFPWHPLGHRPRWLSQCHPKVPVSKIEGLCFFSCFSDDLNVFSLDCLVRMLIGKCQKAMLCGLDLGSL